MYEYLEGRVAARSAARLVLDVGGVGYELLIPLGTPFPAEGVVRVFTHLAVREDAHTLYAFPDVDTRDLFRELLRVRGVGPSMALGVLSGLRPKELLEALVEGDAARLQRVKGVGKKTAEQILLDLGDRAAELLGKERDEAGVLSPHRPGSRREENIADAVAALASVGYSAKESQRLVERAAQKVDPEDLELLVRTSLQG